MTRVRLSGVAAAAVMVLAGAAWGEDVYVSVPLDKVTLTSGKLPGPIDQNEPTRNRHRVYYRGVEAMCPVVTIDGGKGEAYVTVDSQNFNSYATLPLDLAVLRVRLADGVPATGRMLLPRRDWSGMDAVTFKVGPDSGIKEEKKDPKQAFLAAKADYYGGLVERKVAGTAYFRHLAAEARNKLPDDRRTDVMPRGSGNLEDLYSLFTGGKAVAESLQLDRLFLRNAKAQDRTIDVSTLEGITVKAFDWTGRTKDLKNVELDPLATLLPQDQHAIFFRTFAALSTLLEEADANSLPVLQQTEPRSEDALTKERYQKQLGLDMSALGKLLGPTVISSVAITGSDPYLRMGSDMAILFEPQGDVETLRTLLTLQIIKNTSGAAKMETGKALDGFGYALFRSPDRAVCSYVAVVGKTVVVSNSQAQLAAISGVFKKRAEPLATLPEYIYFRHRYPRTDKDETAFLILTDATIRRWCSPKVRIADARRLEATAILADREAAAILGSAEKLRVPVLDMGEVQLAGTRVQSTVYNTLDFMTPIAELEVAKVTQDEADQYKRWRDTYQDYYRKYFDPIALRLSVDKSRLAADVTVMPLIEGTAYKETLGRLAGNVTFGAKASDPHAALLQLVVALDPRSELFKSGSRLVDFGMPSPFSWIGASATLYLEDDPVWAELAKADEPQAAIEKVYTRLPIALRVESSDAVKLALFVTAARRYVEQSAPNTVTFENVTYKGVTYVKVASRAEGPEAERNPLTVYYVTTPGSLLVTINEPLLKRAIDRAAAATQPATATAKPAMEWLGQSAAVHIDRAAMDILFSLQQNQQEATLQTLAWSNLPILNELKRLHPDDDAMAWYGKLFHGRLMEPAGGQYVWNKDLQTYESTVLGSPIAPKLAPRTPAFLPGIISADFGVTFEEDGLRAKVQVLRKTTAP